MDRRPILVLLLICSFLVMSCGSDDSSPVNPQPTPNPEITSITPTKGPVGTSVTIKGSEFSNSKSDMEVMFDGTEATITSTSESTIETQVPEGATSGAVVVVVGGQSVDGPNFTVKAEMPGIQSLKPDSARIGDEIMIKGMNFSETPSENSVSFNGTDASVKNASETSLTVVVPDGATSGEVKVTVGGESTTGPVFTVLPPGPEIDSFDPTTAAEGDIIRIDGSNLGSNDFEPMVKIDGVQATVTDTSSSHLYISVPENASDGPVTVTVAGLTTTSSTDFILDTTGNMRISTETTGSDLDPDGYTITVIGEESKSIGINDSKTFELEEGSYDVEISGLEVNCFAKGGHTTFNGLTISAGETHSVFFQINCKPVLKNQVVFTSTRSGNYQLFVMNGDGSSVEGFSNIGSAKLIPSISPDGLHVIYTEIAGNNISKLHIVDADGANNQVLTADSDSANSYTSWSPDAQRIVYSSNRDGNKEVYVMNIDGSNPVNISNNGSIDVTSTQAWSPNGRILFHSYRDGDPEIYVMDPDGSNVVQLTNNSGTDLNASWSPDGSQIAFSSDRDGNDEIYVMNSDGSGLVRITTNSADDTLPVWSPDGTEIGFVRDDEIYKVNSDGSGLTVNLTNDSAVDSWLSWSPVQ